MEELAKQIEELNKNLRVLISRLPQSTGSLQGGWHVWHHGAPSYSSPPPGYSPQLQGPSCYGGAGCGR